MPTTTSMKTTDAATVAASILERLERAWNDADGAAFGALFTDDSDFVDIRGDHHRGAVAIGRGHQGIFDSIYAGSTVRYRLELAREIAPGAVVAVAGATLDAPHGPLQGVNHSRLTIVLVERDGGWAVTAFHNTLRAGGR
jgi:uncharacterized protein (TIGR02246 family)